MAAQKLRHIAFWLAIITVGIVSALVFASTQQLVRATQWVQHSQTVLYGLEQTLSALKDAETGQRGYLITGQEEYLEPYTKALSGLPDELAQLRELTRDNPNQQERLDRLERLTAERLALLKTGIDARPAGRLGAAEQETLDAGKAWMDQIRGLVGQMVQEESRLYRDRDAAAAQQAKEANTLFLAGTAIGLLTLITLFFRMHHEISGRERAEAALWQLNAELEQRVMEGTAEWRAEAEDRRRRAEELQAVFDAAPYPIIGLDPNNKVMLWNSAAERTFGYDAAELLGEPYPLVPPEESAGFDQIRARVGAGEGVRDFAARRRRKDGKLVDVRLSGAPLYDADGELRGSVMMLEDVTEKRSIERQLMQAQKMEAVGQLTGGIAHDFNNLLSIAIGNLDLLEVELGDNPDAREMVESALRASMRAAELTRQLLAFARKQPLQPRAVDLNRLVTNMTMLLRRTLGEHIQISLRKGRELWEAEADPTQVESALTNLAINARDAMPEGGRLTVETGNMHLDENYAALNPEVKPGDYAMLAVSDTGSGIPAEILDRIFDPFFTTKTEGKGSGLGLSMIYGFAKQSGGHVKIYSEVGHGTTVRLYLPRSRQAAGAVVEAPTVAPTMAQGESILVVEDNPGVRAIVLKQLRALGYRALEAENAAVALDILRSGKPVDLLFTDVVMPGKTGVELAAEAKQVRPDLKVLLTSGFTEEAMRNGHAVQHIPILSKPYRQPDLAEMVQQVLRNEQL